MYSACILMFLMLVGIESRTYYKQMPINFSFPAIFFLTSCTNMCQQAGWSAGMSNTECQTWLNGTTTVHSIWGVAPGDYQDLCKLTKLLSLTVINTDVCICKKTCKDNGYLVGNSCTKCTGVLEAGVSEDVCVTKDKLKAKYNKVGCTRL